MGIGALARAVFLDRDGVLIRADVREGRPYPVADFAAMEILPGVAEALADLKQRGFLLIVVSNQPDVARGHTPRALVEQENAALAAALPVDEIRVCYHDDADECDCRKPRPGLLLAAARERGIDLAASFMVGDRWRDIDAGHQAGCAAVLVDYGYQERAPAQPPETRVKSLREAAAWILGCG